MGALFDVLPLAAKEERFSEDTHPLSGLVAGYEHGRVGDSRIVLTDCLQWAKEAPENSIHAIVTDPPYGVKEYELDQIEKRNVGKGGIWRLPPSFDGNVRAPLPRFTALNNKERLVLAAFFSDWGKAMLRVLRPGGHLFIASNAFLSQLVFSSLIDSGLEFRGEVIRLVRTLRGGDRPKNAELEFPDVSSLPRGAYEPWGLFRKPMLPSMKVSDCLREFQTGGLRRSPDGLPFSDVLMSERTPRKERAIAEHPSLKPQSLLRQLVHASLPLGEGIILDPFSGSGSTVAAAEAMGLIGLGLERHPDYYKMSLEAAPKLADLPTNRSALAQCELELE